VSGVIAGSILRIPAADEPFEHLSHRGVQQRVKIALRVSQSLLVHCNPYPR
jgi:hypothetical protein